MMETNKVPGYLTGLLLLLAVIAHAQPPRIVTAERNFAESAFTWGIKAAFLEHLDSAGLVVNRNTFVNGRQLYQRVINDSLETLCWYPAYACTNQQETFGFTSGPYHYYADRKGMPVSSGYYFSIWQAEPGQMLKVIFDGGVSHSQPALTDLVTFRKETKVELKLNLNRGAAIIIPGRLEKTLATFDVVLAINPYAAYRKFLGSHSLVLRPDQPLHTGAASYLSDSSRVAGPRFTFRPFKTGFDPQGRLYYQLGQLANGSGLLCGYYVRVWQYVAKRWELVADVAQYERTKAG